MYGIPRPLAEDWLIVRQFFTFDVIGNLTFGEPFGCLADGGYHEWVAAIFKNVKASSFYRAAGYYPLLSKALKRFIPSGLRIRRQRHHALTVAKVRRRQERKVEHADFLTGFLQPGADASDDEMIATARLLIIAGSETTATLLSGMTYLVCKHPKVLEKLTDEVRSTFSSETEINLTGANKLRYMLACLDEGMRMYPPVPATFPRNVPPEGDFVGDAWIPGGVSS
jgi:cytochrome P450